MLALEQVLVNVYSLNENSDKIFAYHSTNQGVLIRVTSVIVPGPEQ